jgi:sugar lactone lactonase YvrE
LIRLRALTAAVFICGLLVGASPASAATTHDLTGTWSCCGSGGAATQTWTIATMDKASGAFSGTGQGGSIKMTITGTATGDSVTLTTAYDGSSYSATFKGTLSADSKSMSGSWESNVGQKGTWTATRPSAPTPDDPGDPGDTPGTGGTGGTKAKAVPGDIYVSDSSANTGSGAVYKVNLENGVTTLIHLGPPFSAIRDIAFGPDGNLYVTDIGASAVHQINLKTGAVTRLTKQFDPLLRNPWGIVYDPLLGDFLVSDFFFGSIVRVDPKTGATKELVEDNLLKRAHSIALAPGGPAFVVGFKGQSVVKVEQANGKWSATSFKKGPFAAPFGIAIGTTPAGSRFFLSDAVPYTQAGGVYSWLGSEKPELIESNSVLGTPAGLGLSADGKTLFIGSTGTSAGTGSIIAMNLADRKLKTVATGFVSPTSIIVAPPKKAMVQVSGSGSAANANPNGVTTTVTSPSQPVVASVAVSVNLPSGGFLARASKAVRVKTVQKAIPPGRPTKVRVKFKRALAKKIKAALSAGKKVKAKITVKATAASGASSRSVKRVQIKTG